jgi:hypothetical protein
MTNAQVVWEATNAKVRTDGGDLWKVTFTHRNGKSGSQTYDLNTAESIKLEIILNGGTAEIEKVR